MLYKELNNLDQRKSLPLNGPSNYRVENDVIYTKVLEINATLHCNLSCSNCSHSAPCMQKKEYDLNQLEKDLFQLRKYIKCDIVRIVGGEPLLHSNLKELVRVIKNSKISNKISLITNGVLLPDVDKSLFNDIDELEVSLYPLNDKVRERIKDYVLKIKDKFSKTRILEYNYFRIPFVKNICQNTAIVQSIYNTCQIAHYWRCITIEDGYIYRCPQSMINSKISGNNTDSLKIDNIHSFNELLNFLENNSPLEYCSKCLGSVGKTIDHEQVKKDIWCSLIPLEVEESIDYQYMKEIESNYSSDMKCMKKIKVNNNDKNNGD